MGKKNNLINYLFYLLLGVVFLLPLERIGGFDLDGLNVRISQILVLVVFGLFIFYSFYKKDFKIKIPTPLVFYILFLCISLISIIFAKEKFLGIKNIIFLCFMFLVPYVFVNIINNKKFLKITLYVFLVSAFIFSIFGIFQFFGGMAGLPQSVTGLSFRYVKSVLGFPRIQSTFIEPLYFANYLIIPLVLSLFFLISRIDENKKKYFLVAFFVFLTSGILTFSKGGIATMAIVATGVLLFKIKYIFKKENISYVIIGIIAFLVVSFSSFYFIRSLSNFEKIFEKSYDIIMGASITERQDAYGVAMEAFDRNRLIGVGLGGFGPYFSGYPVSAPDFGWPITNNQYLEILAETGLLGFLAFLAFLISVFYFSYIAYKKTDDVFLKASMVALSFSFLGILIQYMTFSTLYIIHIWVLIGLILSTQEIILKKGGNND